MREVTVRVCVVCTCCKLRECDLEFGIAAWEPDLFVIPRSESTVDSQLQAVYAHGSVRCGDTIDKTVSPIFIVTFS